MDVSYITQNRIESIHMLNREKQSIGLDGIASHVLAYCLYL